MPGFKHNIICMYVINFEEKSNSRSNYCNLHHLLYCENGLYGFYIVAQLALCHRLHPYIIIIIKILLSILL